jgi:hypothetical protein
MEALGGGERRYSSYSFTTSALDGGEWSASRPGRALPPGIGPRYPLYRRLGVKHFKMYCVSETGLSVPGTLPAQISA